MRLSLTKLKKYALGASPILSHIDLFLTHERTACSLSFFRAFFLISAPSNTRSCRIYSWSRCNSIWVLKSYSLSSGLAWEAAILSHSYLITFKTLPMSRQPNSQLILGSWPSTICPFQASSTFAFVHHGLMSPWIFLYGLLNSNHLYMWAGQQQQPWCFGSNSGANHISGESLTRANLEHVRMRMIVENDFFCPFSLFSLGHMGKGDRMRNMNHPMKIIGHAQAVPSRSPVAWQFYFLSGVTNLRENVCPGPPTPGALVHRHFHPWEHRHHMQPRPPTRVFRAMLAYHAHILLA